MATKGGAVSRAKNKLRRKMERQAKARNKKEEYARYGAEGRKKGSRRQKSRKKYLVANVKHETHMCGNVGCKKCFPVLNNTRAGNPQMVAI